MDKVLVAADGGRALISIIEGSILRESDAAFAIPKLKVKSAKLKVKQINKIRSKTLNFELQLFILNFEF